MRSYVGIQYQHSSTWLRLTSRADVDPLSKRKDLLGWIQLIERRSPRGWSIVILPQEIRIDNFHGPLHIHPPRGQAPPEPIAERSMDAVRDRIRRHAEGRRTVVYADLLEELR